MPSQGNPIIKTRIPPDLLADMLAQIAQRNYHTAEEEWTVSAFILKAIREKLSHMKRARRSHNPPPPGKYKGKRPPRALPARPRKGKTTPAAQGELFHEGD